jgi:hypothetical protein
VFHCGLNAVQRDRLTVDKDVTVIVRMHAEEGQRQLGPAEPRRPQRPTISPAIILKLIS